MVNDSGPKHGETVQHVAKKFADKIASTAGARRIRRPEHVEIPIEGENGKLVGRLRVQANRILWGDKETKKWRRVTLDQFIAWINDGKTSGSELVEE